MEKRGRGRPPLPAEDRLLNVETALKPGTLEQVDAVAAATGQKRANVIRAAVERTVAQATPEDWLRRRAWAQGVFAALPKAPADAPLVQDAHGPGHHRGWWVLAIEGTLVNNLRRMVPGSKERFVVPRNREAAIRQLLWAVGPVRLVLTDGLGKVRYEAVVEFGA
ncbi:MAG: hypothetical protein ACYC5O_22790 [Anaerolineae bacterium]